MASGYSLARRLEIESLSGRYEPTFAGLIDSTRLSLLNLTAKLGQITEQSNRERILELRQEFLLELRPLSARLIEIPADVTPDLRSYLAQLLSDATEPLGLIESRLSTLALEQQLDELGSEQAMALSTLLDQSVESASSASAAIAEMENEVAIETRDLRRRLLVLFGLLALSILLAGLYVEFRLARRLQDLVHDVERLAQGELGVAVRGGGDYELAALASSAEIFRRNALELSRASAELVERNRALDEFAHAASHDLKAPLRGISNLAQWIEADCRELLPKESLDHLMRLQTRTSKLESLLEKLLEFSRLGNELSLYQHFCVVTMAKEVLEMTEIPAGGSLHFSGVGAPLPVFAIRAPLELIFANLVGNAFLHHDLPNPVVDLRFVRRGDDLRIEVMDDGPGIAPEFREQAFRMFSKLSHSSGGSGMGLAFVGRAVETLDGHCEIYDRAPRGTVIRVELPGLFRSHAEDETEGTLAG